MISQPGSLRSKRVQHVRRGFTLLEILLVLAIMIVIFAMVVPSLLGRGEKANRDVTKISIKNLEGALKFYAGEHLATGYPNDLNQLLNPLDPDGKEMEPYLDEIPKDAWGRPFFYEFPNTKAPNMRKPAIWSAGPDGKDDNGANDDINNWDDVDTGQK